MLSLCKSLLFFQTWKWCPSRYAGASHSVFGTEVLESPNSFKFSSSCWIMGAGWMVGNWIFGSGEVGTTSQRLDMFWIYLSMPDVGSSPPRMITFFEENSLQGDFLCKKNCISYTTKLNRGHSMTPNPNQALFLGGNPSKLSYICIVWSPP